MKVLDFGLAKAFQPDASDPNMSMSPTISLTAAATQMGIVFGTAAYMAPEQASEKVVDKRADVWAFGVVLYEMLSGTRPFVGDDVSKTLAQVIAIDPDWNRLPQTVPHVLATFLHACLKKEPKQRVHDIADVRLAVERAFETAPAEPAIGVTHPTRQRRGAIAAAVLGSLAVGWLAVWARAAPRGRPKRNQETRGTIPAWLRVPHRARRGVAVQFSISLRQAVERRAQVLLRLPADPPEGAAPRRRQPPARVVRSQPLQVEHVDEQREVIVRRMEAFLRRAVGLLGRHGSGATGHAHAPSLRLATTPGVTGGAGGRAARYAHSRALAVCNSASCTML